MGYQKPITAAEFLQKNPYCWRCGRNEEGQYFSPATHAILNMRSNPEPVCDGHYRDFCVGFGNFLVMSILSGAGRRYRNV